MQIYILNYQYQFPSTNNHNREEINEYTDIRIIIIVVAAQVHVCISFPAELLSNLGDLPEQMSQMELLHNPSYNYSLGDWQ